MGLVAIGVDLAEIDRIEDLIARYGNRFLKRVFTQNEITYCSKKVTAASSYAARFAAKEATAKAMGTGFSQGLSLHHIGVTHDDAGKPILDFIEVADDFMQENKILQTHLSLADEKDYAVAFVTLVL